MEITQEELNYFIEETKKISEYDFENYSLKSFKRRVEKILIDHKMDVETLVKKMKQNKKFLEIVVKEITVNTTEPFRTPTIWLKLIPIIKEKFAELEEIKIWHAGCSIGQELYSMLILLYEMGFYHKVKIYGSDINEDVMNVARTGKYRLHDFDEHWNNFDEVMQNFDTFKKENYLEINKRRSIVKMKNFLVEKPTFLKHNLIKDKDIFGFKFDLIMCRNVLIYFNHEIQDKIFRFFYDMLNTKGTLVIGKHESILSSTQQKFIRTDSIYQKKDENDSWT